MKKKITVIFMSFILISSLFAGCGTKDKMEEALVVPPKEKIEKSQIKNNEVSKKIEIIAKREDVSLNEMKRMLDELVEIIAKRNMITVTEYYDSLEEGVTPIDEILKAADYMGITIKEYYEYEKNKPEMTNEQKEIVKGMNDLAKNFEKMDTEVQEVLIVDFKDFGLFNMEKVISQNMNEELFMIEYISNSSYEDVVAHYKEKLEGTPNSMFYKEPNGDIATIIGTINDNDIVNIAIYPINGGVKSKVYYTYNGNTSNN